MKKTLLVIALLGFGSVGCDMYYEDNFPSPIAPDGGPPQRTVSDVDFRPDAGSDNAQADGGCGVEADTAGSDSDNTHEG